MINCIILKWLGDFNITKNLSILSKFFSSGIDDGLGENESMTRIKEHPSYFEKIQKTQTIGLVEIFS